VRTLQQREPVPVARTAVLPLMRELRGFGGTDASTSLRYARRERATPLRYARHERATPLRYARRERATPLRYARHERATPLRYARRKRATPLRYARRKRATPLRYARCERAAVPRSRGGRRLRVWLALLVGISLTGCNKTPEDHLRLAHDAIFDKNPHRALEEYRHALDLLERSGSTQAPGLRARALLGAADVYYLELRDPPRAVEIYRELIQSFPDAPETLTARLQLAQILRVHYRDLRGAISELAAAIAQNPPQSAELKYEVAKLYFELSDFQQCELEADAVVQKYGASAYVERALFLKAQALEMVEGKHAEATCAFQDLIDRFPHSELQPHALFEIGKMRAEAGELESAIEIWVRALKNHPDPEVVQSAISRLRKRIEATTPARVGLAALKERQQAKGLLRPAPRTSIEAAGGSAEEAARDRGER